MDWVLKLALSPYLVVFTNIAAVLTILKLLQMIQISWWSITLAFVFGFWPVLTLIVLLIMYYTVEILKAIFS